MPHSILKDLFYLVLGAWFCFGASNAAAVPLDNRNSFDSQEKSAETKPADSAAREISGSRYPGILDHLLILPANPKDKTPQLQVRINYPSTGQREVDSDIRDWVSNLAEIFATHLASLSGSGNFDDAETNNDPFLHDNDLNSEGPVENLYELWGDYSISRPSDKALSVTFELWNYAGSPQGNLDILTLNYNLANGQRLELVDIFEDPEQALILMSNFSRQQLESRFGTGAPSRMLIDGTAPLIENFSSLTLTKEGISVNFQPWQVAPWEVGIQKVTIPLTELLAAGPLLSLWDK